MPTEPGDRLAPSAPSRALAGALLAATGHVIQWGGENRRYRWNGTDWAPLQPGDWVLSAGDGLKVRYWTGTELVQPRVTEGRVEDLARVIDPEAFEFASPNGIGYARMAARNALTYGYDHRLHPSAPPAPGVLAQRDDPPAEPAQPGAALPPAIIDEAWNAYADALGHDPTDVNAPVEPFLAAIDAISARLGDVLQAIRDEARSGQNGDQD